MLQRVQRWHLFKSCFGGLKHLSEHQRLHITSARVGCVMSGKAESVVQILVRAAICMNCVLSTLGSVHVLVMHLHTCVCVYVPQSVCTCEALLDGMPSPVLMFSSCEGNSGDGFLCAFTSSLSLYLFSPWRGGMTYLISKFGKNKWAC